MQTNYDVDVERFLGFDPATLYEAAGLRGMVDPTIRPAWAGAQICGPAFTAVCPPGDNLMLHHAVASAPPGVVIVATLGSYMLTGAWGEILTVAAQAREITGLVVDGAVRDIEAIAQHRFPVFSRGLAIGACTKERVGKLQVPIVLGGATVSPGDLIFGNADGLVVVESARIDQVYEAAMARQHRETNLMDQLRAGKTTLELLKLPPLVESEVAGQ
ncbi:MAG TPA: RraA family protein [Verrucomicrobiae bacterium]|nr:RraA family protein [Verrucomicrobiae bacterium]